MSDLYIYIILYIYNIIYYISDLCRTYADVLLLTSSTGQGGGGSFKNRKPIGEVGCFESGMAKRSH